MGRVPDGTGSSRDVAINSHTPHTSVSFKVHGGAANIQHDGVREPRQHRGTADQIYRAALERRNLATANRTQKHSYVKALLEFLNQ